MELELDMSLAQSLRRRYPNIHALALDNLTICEISQLRVRLHYSVREFEFNNATLLILSTTVRLVVATRPPRTTPSPFTSIPCSPAAAARRRHLALDPDHERETSYMRLLDRTHNME